MFPLTLVEATGNGHADDLEHEEDSHTGGDFSGLVVEGVDTMTRTTEHATTREAVMIGSKRKKWEHCCKRDEMRCGVKAYIVPTPAKGATQTLRRRRSLNKTLILPRSYLLSPPPFPSFFHCHPPANGRPTDDDDDSSVHARTYNLASALALT